MTFVKLQKMESQDLRAHGKSFSGNSFPALTTLLYAGWVPDQLFAWILASKDKPIRPLTERTLEAVWMWVFS